MIRNTSRLSSADHCSSCILVPAHNEELGIESTLESLFAAKDQTDTIVVIADNCTDNTYQLAKTFDDVTVLQRQNDIEKGKGFALAHGFNHISGEPYDVVIVIDADCKVSKHLISELKKAAKASAKPVQAKYLMRAPTGSGATTRIAEFAFLIKNFIRPKGLNAMNAPVPLQGTGMAFPKHLLSYDALANGDLVEDMKLGVDLTLTGNGALFIDSCEVYSEFPNSEHGIKSQRERWEHGHLNTIRHYAFPGIRHAISHRNFTDLLFFIDLTIPPVTLLILLNIGLLSLAFINYVLFSSAFPLIGSLLLFAAMSVGIAFVWYKYGKSIISLNDIAKIPLFIAKKLFVYLKYLTKKQTSWIRTKRD